MAIGSGFIISSTIEKKIRQATESDSRAEQLRSTEDPGLGLLSRIADACGEEHALIPSIQADILDNPMFRSAQSLRSIIGVLAFGFWLALRGLRCEQKGKGYSRQNSGQSHYLSL
jgi:hypothetical protein